jgi:hypothetical protein
MPMVNGFYFENDDKYIRQTEYDLAQTGLHIVYDNGEEELYSFVTGEDAIRVDGAQHALWLRYGCLKMRKTVRFISFEVPGKPLYECVTLVIDEENGLVTRVTTVFGGHPTRPALAQTQYEFGAVKRDGQALAEKRHCDTTELTGKKIAWTYSNGFVNVHIYRDHVCRAQALQRPEGEQTPLIDDPIYEEPARYIKIREHLYLLSNTEANINRRDPLAGGNNLLLLIDTDSMTDVGRNFRRLGPTKRAWGMLHAFGRWYTETMETELAESPNYI